MKKNISRNEKCKEQFYSHKRFEIGENCQNRLNFKRSLFKKINPTYLLKKTHAKNTRNH